MHSARAVLEAMFEGYTLGEVLMPEAGSAPSEGAPVDRGLRATGIARFIASLLEHAMLGHNIIQFDCC
jgi:hypothetical protein